MVEKTKKRLLIVVPVYVSYRIFLKGLSSWLVTRGWEVHVASNLSGFNADEDVVFLHDLPIPRGASPFRLFKSGRELKRIIQVIKPCIVHAYFSVGLLVLAIAGRESGVRYLGTFQGLRFPLSKGLGRWLFKLVECFSILRLDQSWVLTEDDYCSVPSIVWKKLAIQEGYGFGCDIEHFTPERFTIQDTSNLRFDLGISEDAVVFIFVGRLTAFKGFLLVLEAFQRLRQERTDVELLVVGDLDSMHPINLPELNLIPGVHHVGWQDDPAPYLAISNVMVFPSEREGMPVCMMEALSMGLSLVTVDSRGCRDLARLSSIPVVPRSVDCIYKTLRATCCCKTADINPTEVRAQIDRHKFYSMLQRYYEHGHSNRS